MARHPIETALKGITRLGLAAFMLMAGIGHFRSTESFRAQVPPFLPYTDMIIYVSGVFEIAIALGLVLLPRWRTQLGWALAAFYVVIFPGNISQYLTQTSAFGLDTDAARATRLLFQPVLIVLALWSTNAWKSWRSRSRR